MVAGVAGDAVSGQHAGDHMARLDDGLEAFARLGERRRGPDLDAEGDRDARFEELLAVVPVRGLPRRGALFVQGPVAGPQPAEGGGAVVVQH
ncbi:hypothetical protein Srubr_38830 [Streptomyces rubradiris]|uniref:Uncharacterized protein n=1 Tax=Streptomyces rubradiris TaxID=285531 RepID=A0ABQ3RDW2_STRRR|nr:hypothetical protein [Streptomyces rubradiris]GHH28325.1 hypothetical protein GCM10018792_71870 [Streptomyces rubradiris]GHI54037.1 hypothetical protein Srubr_38830 [Streptomyces rubradiris]